MKKKTEEKILIELDRIVFKIIFHCLRKELDRCKVGSERRKEIWDVFENFYTNFDNLKNDLPTIHRH